MDIKGTNIELFGSELDKKIKEESAKTEPLWNKIDMNTPGLYVWRIEQFKLVEIFEKGVFYEGDSYIVLSITKPKQLVYNIHFWIGNKSTIDEMGTAAYKTVELDTFLKGSAVQYREIQFNETELFRSYFNQNIEYRKGGVASGFRKVTEYDYSDFIPLLFKVHNGNILNVSKSVESLTDDDSFLYDSGLVIYNYHGANSSNKEHYVCSYVSNNIKNNRKNCSINEINKDDLIKLLNNNTDYKSKKLFRVRNIDHNLTVSEYKDTITYDSFTSDDAFVFTISNMTFIWIGQSSNYYEMLDAWKLAFKITNRASSIIMVRQNYEPEMFFTCL